MTKEHQQKESQLLQEYRELQLRVTRFSAVEQQLINTRDRLDHELELYKRLHRFNSRALQEQSDADFANLITEAIIDIFEVEGAAYYFEKEGTDERFLAMEGLHLNKDTLAEFIREIKEHPWNESALILQASHLGGTASLKDFAEGLYFRFSDSEIGYSACLLGLISAEHAPLYQKLHSRHEAIFGVFAQQVQSLVANRQKGTRIREQMRQISDSEQELRKLSFIATRTKNGVIITDANGRIEWVNDSFVKTTGYDVAEVIGKDVVRFLEHPDLESSPGSALRTAIENKQFAEVTTHNYSKLGVPFVNQLEITPVQSESEGVLNFVVLQKDITAETSFREELLKVNSRFELITMRSQIGIWEWVPNSHQSSWNSTLKTIFGLPPDFDDDQLPAQWTKATHAEDWPRIERMMAQLQSGELDRCDVSYRITRLSDGAPRVLDSLMLAERDSRGKVRRLIGTCTDVTESVEAELKLKASEEKYRHIIENMNLGLVEVDQQGEIVFMNDKLRELTGLEDPGLMLQAIRSAGRPDFELEHFALRSYQKIGESVFEITFERQDQQVITLLESSATVRDQAHQVTGTISIYLDISSVKALQKNLEEAIVERDSFIQKVNAMKLFYEGILNHSPAEIFVINPDQTLRYVNRLFAANEPGIEAFVGCSLSALNGRDEADRKRWEKLRAMVASSLSQGRLVQYEELCQQEGREDRYLLRNILPSYNDRKVLQHVVVSGVDITDVKRIQADIVRKNEELRKINAELDNFVYSVSHDLRSPLLSIKGILELILDRGGLEESGQKFVKLACDSADRLDGTIQEILEYSRNARLEIKSEHFDIAALVKVIFDDLRFTDPAGIALTVEVDGDVNVVTDRYRVTTLLKNLIGNAVKFRRPHITDAFVRVRIQHQPGRLQIAVEDNGEGISARSVSRIFDMFYRGSSNTVGTGLGLYICKEILNKLGGTVDVQSEVGAGTTMTLTIPLQESTQLL